MKIKYIKAFTLMELVLVIVVVGILSALVIPRLERNALLEAANQIVSHIRYTQHLAMMDNKFDANDTTWFKERWTIEFNNARVNNTTEWRYHVYADTSKSGNLNSAAEVAKDPQNSNRYLSGGWGGISNADLQKINKKMNLGSKFGVTNVIFGNDCSGRRRSNISISFDEKGRPMLKVSTTAGGGATNPVDRLITADCTITLQNANSAINPDEEAIITISPETGFVKLTKTPKI
ncbi:prepilin-type N-terminal cleavage/methylation domain-containing protein [Campylobacter geochelonis]|uniref:Carbamoyl-phosphate synthase large subunit n=1 Tax=Campylobacter geochelonis TaxID=1780362 RepID=A0A128EFP1_9BACT|nr:prepilin-type N-terminal cleavage/methylation domain-containing protein [Campylobacter geochelonis]QKF71401.1 hypothetical protein CGEO_1096 [Campylobacter geochelonis]CZE47739.1 carbamoyl-phosphate synthase large subunit [Campylobacter geochelonis]CZE48417.1 carbamoyl-phosphate synthase large subunit [Campylobacter geochelonis]CZE50898.1 carbamoyl-phosphate synthase large subunit [Campylobacter geochelonis]